MTKRLWHTGRNPPEIILQDMIEQYNARSPSLYVHDTDDFRGAENYRKAMDVGRQVYRMHNALAQGEKKVPTIQEVVKGSLTAGGVATGVGGGITMLAQPSIGLSAIVGTGVGVATFLTSMGAGINTRISRQKQKSLYEQAKTDYWSKSEELLEHLKDFSQEIKGLGRFDNEMKLRVMASKNGARYIRQELPLRNTTHRTESGLYLLVNPAAGHTSAANQ